ncbi:MAG: HypC/HybG/HupF family hydrogenase formation chaperone [Candidatus Cloacimonadota bacterium]|nr:HypC/HybG/HupF family hydrogenase formation chaperone [Candidatus Cloacimonadota bacterium]
MCLAVPYRVVSIKGNKAKADVYGVVKEIDVRILQNLKEDDFVLVHAGFAIQKVNQEEAHETLRLLEKLSEATPEFKRR